MLRFHIANMTCGGCAKGVGATLREVDPAVELRFDLERREVEVDRSSADAAALQAALIAAGWESERRAA
ncbi:heavy-metal-associated domain-containing protein [Falsiroseomonas oryzae]|uniref:heavy-metal-associated domain-containing protein n=1 Tax=Falsiroseomonas oryzae TaxID=2766473 RepID=UPI0022EA76B7|nr:heavy-metal-associated domain-containing protein [Roseomonas sp. MO-31]